MATRRTSLPRRALTPLTACALTAFVLGALWIRPVVKYTLLTFPPRISFRPQETTSLSIGIKNTGGADSFLWIVVTAKNAEVVPENECTFERTDQGIRIMAMAEKQTDDLYRLLNVEVRPRDRAIWFIISIGVEKRISWSPSGIVASFGDIKRVPPTSATYVIEDTKDSVSTYVLTILS